MRELVFKAKKVTNNKWVEGSLLRLNNMDEYYIVRNFASHRVDGGTVCQKTGIKDKFGRTIWENDGCYIDSPVCIEGDYICEWANEYGAFVLNGPEMVDFSLVKSENLEVIGNMYDLD